MEPVNLSPSRGTRDLVVMVPTYNEIGNVEKLIPGISALGLDADLLFIDDNSPDGTGALLEKLKSRFPRLTVLHREGKLGVGSAHLFGIRWAYAQGYQRM